MTRLGLLLRRLLARDDAWLHRRNNEWARRPR
jgi:hypothetical protein